MKLIVIQKDTTKPEIHQYLDDIQERQPDLVCLGELATTGCLYNGGTVDDYREVIKSLEKYDFDICLGMPRAVESKLFNSYVYVSQGRYQIYDKINLFEPMNEAIVYQRGEQITVFETRFGRIGASICYDIRFPDIYEKLKEKGVDLILVPAAFPRVRIRDWHDLLITRAKETGTTVVGINAVGNDGTYEFGGTSMVVDKKGMVLARADEINESIIEVNL